MSKLYFQNVAKIGKDDCFILSLFSQIKNKEGYKISVRLVIYRDTEFKTYGISQESQLTTLYYSRALKEMFFFFFYKIAQLNAEKCM